MRGMTRALNTHGWDVVCLNFRGCSGEPNRLVPSYHSGKSHDLKLVLHKIVESNLYPSIAIIGFSLGGNVTLKFSW